MSEAARSRKLDMERLRAEDIDFDPDSARLKELSKMDKNNNNNKGQQKPAVKKHKHT
jgi:hypothetical protein